MLWAGAASAQVYQWRDAGGVTHFSDTPPPPSVSSVSVKQPYRIDEEPPALPLQLSEALKKYPVTLYTTDQCDSCERGRALLMARGIPYLEKTVNSAQDQAALQGVGGTDRLPLLLVGSNKYVGYEPSAWDAALTLATYPLRSMLPLHYQVPAVAPAATPRQSGTATQVRTPEASREQPPPPGAAPHFQF